MVSTWPISDIMNQLTHSPTAPCSALDASSDSEHELLEDLELVPVAYEVHNDSPTKTPTIDASRGGMPTVAQDIRRRLRSVACKSWALTGKGRGI